MIRVCKALLLSIAAGLLFGCSDPAMTDSNPGLQVGLTRYFEALLHGQHRISIDMMDPRFVPNREAKEEGIAFLQNSTTNFVYHRITNQKPFGHFKGSNSFHCFVPYISDAQIGTQRATVKSYLIATRYQGSNTWYFVDVGKKSRTFLAQYYENLPKELPQASVIKRQ
jgi:hypothetical protein